MNLRFQQGMAYHASVAVEQLSAEVQLNGHALSVVLMPIERTDPRIAGGFLDGVLTQAFVKTSDWAEVGGALSQVITLPGGTKGRIAKLTIQEGGLVLDIAPENQVS